MTDRISPRRRAALTVLLVFLGSCMVAGALRSWDVVFPDGTNRFSVLTGFDDEAVLDRETQLVWEQAPSTTLLNFANAHARCAELSLGDRRGWKMPSASQLTSLMDSSQSPEISVNHPFTADFQTSYWVYLANEGFSESGTRTKVSFVDGSVSPGQAGTAQVWCVRAFE